VQLTILDENDVVVSDARVTIVQLGQPPVELLTNAAGRTEFSLSSRAPYRLQIDKPGFYRTLKPDVDPQLHDIELILQHEQIVSQEVNVVASSPNIDPQQTADVSTMNTPEIVNIPYVTNRDIVNLLPFNPGVIQDPTGQVHVAGSPTYATLDLLDGFDLRSPASGTLSLHISTDAVRSIVTESTRYPVEYGKATGGVIAFSSGMGDNRYRFNATDFIPSYVENNGIHFDKFIPRVTFSGPIAKNKAWYFDGFDLAYAANYIVGLPANADTNPSWQESNLAKFQFNLTPRNNLIAALLFNDAYSPFSGLSTLMPRASTVKSDTLAWLPYLRDQHLFANGTLLDLGIGITRIHSGYEPHGDTPYQLTPETAEGSYFENLTGRSSRIQESFALYLSPRRWIGEHNLQVGVDLDQITAKTSSALLSTICARMGLFSARVPFPRNLPSPARTPTSEPMSRITGSPTQASPSIPVSASTGIRSFAARCTRRASQGSSRPAKFPPQKSPPASVCTTSTRNWITCSKPSPASATTPTMRPMASLP
jgi:hypothetical protein